MTLERLAKMLTRFGHTRIIGIVDRAWTARLERLETAGPDVRREDIRLATVFHLAKVFDLVDDRREDSR